jgi:sugar O-acyltransferase (sialic acid O-acetyltransferase NeuD family)
LKGQKKRKTMIRTQSLDIIIVGAGGHAAVAAEILCRGESNQSSFDLVGFVDDNPDLIGKEIMGSPVLGASDALEKIPHDAIFIAIGRNSLRAKLFQEYLAQMQQMINLIHPSAVIASDVSLGMGVMIGPGVIINPGTIIGDDVILNTGSSVDHHNQIGAHAHIAPGVHLGGEVVVGEGSLVGIGATVIPRCVIGSWSVIAAGATVTDKVGDHVLVAGVPAHFVKQLTPKDL